MKVTWLPVRLRARSAPERLPHLAKGLGDATLSDLDKMHVLHNATFKSYLISKISYIGLQVGYRVLYGLIYPAETYHGRLPNCGF